MKSSKPGEHQAWFKRYYCSGLARAVMVRSKRRRRKLTAGVEELQRFRFMTPVHAQEGLEASQQETGRWEEASFRQDLSCAFNDGAVEAQKWKLKSEAKNGMGSSFFVLAVATLLIMFGGLIDLGELLGCLAGAGLACWMIWNDALNGGFPPAFAAVGWLSIAIGALVFVLGLHVHDLFVRPYFWVFLAGGFWTLYIGTRTQVSAWPDDHAPQSPSTLPTTGTK